LLNGLDEFLNLKEVIFLIRIEDSVRYATSTFFFGWHEEQLFWGLGLVGFLSDGVDLGWKVNICSEVYAHCRFVGVASKQVLQGVWISPVQ
jgi:hypothetical protein